MSAYCASKYALESLASALRMEQKNRKIKVVMIRPGKIQTPFHDTALLQMKNNVGQMGSEYTAEYEQFRKNRQSSSNSGNLGLPPKHVARVIYRIILKKRPRTIYYVTWQAKLAGRLRSFFPLHWIEKCVRHFS